MTTPQRNKSTPRGRPGDHAPFAWQERKMTNLIRGKYFGEKRAVALAIYQTLTDCACDAGRLIGEHTGTFRVSHIEIAGSVSKSVSTIKRYLNELRTLGVIDWECSKRGKVNNINKWILLGFNSHNSERAPVRHGEPRRVAHNSELEKKERLKRYVSKKGKSNDFRNTEGAESAGEIIKRRYGL